MTHPESHRAVWWLLVAGFAAGIVGVVLAASRPGRSDLSIPALLAYGAVGAFLARRRPGNAIGWIFLLVGILAVLSELTGQFVQTRTATAQPVTGWLVAAAWGQVWLWFALLVLALPVTALLFPSGLPSPGWRPAFWVLTGILGAFTLGFMVFPDLPLGDSGRSVPNPLCPAFLAPLGRGSAGDAAFVASQLALAVGTLIGASSVVWRAKRATKIEREQLRWFIFAVACLVACLLLQGLGESDTVASEAALGLALALVPVACGVAITRYRLYDIDRIISRTTSYAVVTGVLVAVYAVVVTSVTRLVPVSSSLAVAAATLAAAALARPLLGRVQQAVDRRFNRARFDAAGQVEAFAARLRDAVDPSTVSSELLATVDTTLQPAVLGLHLVGRR